MPLNLPGDCRQTSRAGVLPGDRLDAAILKYDAALSRQNDRTLRCAEWFDSAISGKVSAK